MTYLDSDALMRDVQWTARGQAAIREVANEFSDDSRPEYSGLAWAVAKDPQYLPWSLLYMLAVSPGVNAEMSDQALKSAVQTAWPKMGRGYIPPV